MSNNNKKYYIFNVNRVVIFGFIVASVYFDNGTCAVIAAAFWLWLPHIEKFESSFLHDENEFSDSFNNRLAKHHNSKVAGSDHNES